MPVVSGPVVSRPVLLCFVDCALKQTDRSAPLALKVACQQPARSGGRVARRPDALEASGVVTIRKDAPQVGSGLGLPRCESLLVSILEVPQLGQALPELRESLCLLAGHVITLQRPLDPAADRSAVIFSPNLPVVPHTCQPGPSGRSRDENGAFIGHSSSASGCLSQTHPARSLIALRRVGHVAFLEASKFICFEAQLNGRKGVREVLGPGRTHRSAQ